MKIIKYECPRADCQKVQSFRVDNNCKEYQCQDCMTLMTEDNIIGVEQIDNSQSVNLCRLAGFGNRNNRRMVIPKNKRR